MSLGRRPMLYFAVVRIIRKAARVHGALDLSGSWASREILRAHIGFGKWDGLTLLGSLRSPRFVRYNGARETRELIFYTYGLALSARMSCFARFAIGTISICVCSWAHHTLSVSWRGGVALPDAVACLKLTP